MDKKRVGALDEIRGFCILCMVVYHIMFDLKFLFGMDVPFFFEWWFNIIRDIFAGTFIFISGCVTQYSKNNYKRGTQCFFLGMIITFVTAFVSPSVPVYFGILHLLGISMIIYALFEFVLNKIKPFLGLIICTFLFAFTFNVRNGYIGFENILPIKFTLPAEIYKAGLLFPLGFPERDFSTGDYFPLFPWLFLFLLGSYIGQYFKSGVMPKSFYSSHNNILSFIGKHTLWIYLLHQPIAYLILTLILG